MSGLVARRPKGTELGVTRWLERNAARKPVGFELRCVSSAEPYVLERLPPARASALEAFARDVLELAQEDADARGERTEYHLVMLGDAGGVVADDSTLSTHVIRCLPREKAEPDTAAVDALRLLADHQQALMKSYLSLSTSAMAEVQRVSSVAIEATRGLVAPLARRVEKLEAENESLRETVREAEQVIAFAGAEEEGADRAERRTQSLEKLSAAVLHQMAKSGDLEAAGFIQQILGTDAKKGGTK